MNQKSFCLFLQEVNEVLADAFFGLKNLILPLFTKKSLQIFGLAKSQSRKVSHQRGAAMIEAQQEISDNLILIGLFLLVLLLIFLGFVFFYF